MRASAAFLTADTGNPETALKGAGGGDSGLRLKNSPPPPRAVCLREALLPRPGRVDVRMSLRGEERAYTEVFNT